jgi:hypothetical protein
MRPSPAFSVFFLLALLAGLTAAQTQSGRAPLVQPRPAQRLLKNSIVLVGGVMTPLTHPSLKDFWNLGPSAALTVFANVNRFVSFGAGAEGSLLLFKGGAFSEHYPGVSAHPLKTANLHFFVAWKYTGRLGTAIAPTFSATLGGSKMTKAVYEERIAGVRTTYYNIPGRMRLTLGAAPGIEFALNRGIALVVEGRMLYLYNDPEAGLLAGGRCGLRWNF